MHSKCTSCLVVVCLVVGCILTTANADVFGHRDRITRKMNDVSDGSEAISADKTGISYTDRSTGPGEIMGITYLDYQHNGSMGRQVAYDPINNCVHFAWRHSGSAGGFRNVAYNSYSISTATWHHGSGVGAGKIISTDGYTAGYCSMDISSTGAAVVAHHQYIDITDYRSVADIDSLPPEGHFDFVPGAPGAPNCQGWHTGQCEDNSEYIWPIVEYDNVDGDDILHVVSCESEYDCGSAGDVMTMVYYRKLNDAWPSCGLAIDSIHVVAPVVRSSPTSDKVAIVWLKPIHYDGDPNDPCGYRAYQHDLYYVESTDGGETWGTYVNITDYTQGGTVGIDEVDHLPFNDVSALYVGNTLHVTWPTNLRDPEYDPCAPLSASKLWHWDDNSQCISLVYDASHPRFHCDPGAWNYIATPKQNISECDGKLYVSFTRFGAYTSGDGDTNKDCSAGGYANGEIFITASTNGGQSWGEAHNVTNTFTPGCEPGDCLSEHWSSMAKYSTDVLHLQYIEDRDAGGIVFYEGDPTENPVKYLTYECFTPETWCDFSISPTEIDNPTFIAPEGHPECWGDETYTFDLIITNSGTENTTYTITPSDDWIHPAATAGEVLAGCNYLDTVSVTLGPIPDEGIYDGTITVTACGGEQLALPIELYVHCYVNPPGYQILATACWSIAVWDDARTGAALYNDPEGNMYWFIDEVSMMYDESPVITYADDTCATWFSIFDGSDDDVDFRSFSGLWTATFPTYEYAQAVWGTGDSIIVGEIEYYLPIHPDTCVIIERIELCNAEDTTVRIHIGTAIDWDIPDGGDGFDNQSGYDPNRHMLYQYGPPGTPEEEFFGGASFCHDIPGGRVLMNDIWVYPNSGFVPCRIGGLLARQSTFDLAPRDSVEDLSTVYVVAQDLELEPDLCYHFCLVKSSSLNGLANLRNQIDRGKQWIIDHELNCPDCPGPCEGVWIGDADGSGAPTFIDIDDVVYLINYIFLGGPAPTPYEVASGDPNASCQVDIDDVVWLIYYIFAGIEPPSCEEWIDICGELH